MGKLTGFLEYGRCENGRVDPKERIKNFDEFYMPLSEEDRREQGARCMDCGVPMCQSGMELNGAVTGCPLHNLIPEWNDELYRGHMSLALSRLLKTNNFPEFTGRVCPALCEKACICGIHDAPVTVHDNERFIIETGFESGEMAPRIPKMRSGRRVAVIGSGPAGLAVADQLNHRGHSVTVFEKADRPGGLLMYGIPNMKLDKSVIDRRIELMKAEGVEFECGVDVGSDPAPASDILSKFDAVALCCGARVPRTVDLGSDDAMSAKGVTYALEYLTACTRAQLGLEKQDPVLDARGKNVIIIGGGDTGNDCVGVAIRQGAKSVTQLIRRPAPPVVRTADNQWPEYPKTLKVDYGQEEGIAVFGSDPRLFEHAVRSLKIKNGVLKSANVAQVKVDKDRKTTPVPGTEKDMKCDLLILASGFSGCEPYVPNAFGVSIDRRGNVQSGSELYRCGTGKVFTAGDMHRGASLVVHAIAEGRACAREIDRFLMSYTNME